MSTAVQVRQKAKHPGGRPIFDGRPEHVIIANLKAAFARGCNVEESCCYAEISTYAYYRWLEKHPEFRTTITALQSRPEMKSKWNITDKIENGNVRLSQWWLEKKQGSGFNGSDYDKSSSVPEGQDMDNQGIARIIAVCIGRSIAEYEAARQSGTGKTAKDL